MRQIVFSYVSHLWHLHGHGWMFERSSLFGVASYINHEQRNRNASARKQVNIVWSAMVLVPPAQAMPGPSDAAAFSEPSSAATCQDRCVCSPTLYRCIGPLSHLGLWQSPNLQSVVRSGLWTVEMS